MKAITQIKTNERVFKALTFDDELVLFNIGHLNNEIQMDEIKSLHHLWNGKWQRFGKKDLLDTHKLSIESLPISLEHGRLAVAITREIMKTVHAITQGLSIGSFGQEPPKYGYMVGTGAEEFDAQHMHFNQINAKVGKMLLVANGKNDLYIGAWRNGDSVVVELSEWIPSRGTALVAANLRNQISIWDIAEEVELSVKELNNKYIGREDY